jgi:hypothetical protein
MKFNNKVMSNLYQIFGAPGGEIFEVREQDDNEKGPFSVEIHYPDLTTMVKVLNYLQELGLKRYMTLDEQTYYREKCKTDEQKKQYLKKYFKCEDVEIAKKGDFYVKNFGIPEMILDIIITNEKSYEVFKAKLEERVQQKNDAYKSLIQPEQTASYRSSRRPKPNNSIQREPGYMSIAQLLNMKLESEIIMSDWFSNKEKKLPISKEEIIAKFPLLKDSIKEVKEGIIKGIRIIPYSDEQAKQIENILRPDLEENAKKPLRKLINVENTKSEGVYVSISFDALKALKAICRVQKQEIEK